MCIVCLHFAQCPNFIKIKLLPGKYSVHDIRVLVLHFQTLQPHLDGQHDVSVALQHLHSTAVADVLKAHSVGSQDLVTHLYSVLLGQTTWIQSETKTHK